MIEGERSFNLNEAFQPIRLFSLPVYVAPLESEFCCGDAVQLDEPFQLFGGTSPLNPQARIVSVRRWAANSVVYDVMAAVREPSAKSGWALTRFSNVTPRRLKRAERPEELLAAERAVEAEDKKRWTLDEVARAFGVPSPALAQVGGVRTLGNNPAAAIVDDEDMEHVRNIRLGEVRVVPPADDAACWSLMTSALQTAQKLNVQAGDVLVITAPRALTDCESDVLRKAAEAVVGAKVLLVPFGSKVDVVKPSLASQQDIRALTDAVTATVGKPKAKPLPALFGEQSNDPRLGCAPYTGQ